MQGGNDGEPLRLGPLMRYVDATSATLWVETESAGTVTVHAAGRSWSARTFGVHGHHYALVACDGLEPGTIAAYTVEVDGRHAWPPDDYSGHRLPPPVITTVKPGKPPRLAFGSCRTSVTHDETGNAKHGVDALRAYALAMGGVTMDVDALPWPDMVLFLGDQVYADETTTEMREFIDSRRDIEQPPGPELKDYEEYAHLYRLAWSDPVNRWLLSTLPSAMIFDDHDIRDDWNTSDVWRREMNETEWWHDRIVAGLGSYWVYQHLGNLSPDERAEDPLWARVASYDGEDELDLSAEVDAFAERADDDPGAYRWSFARELNGSRLVIVDTRAARVLSGERNMLDPEEMQWLDEQMTGDVEHLLVGTSLPFLLPEGLHNLEGFSEALAAGAWGRRAARFGEVLRQGVDLEHWGAFQRGFQQVAHMAAEVAVGRRGAAPRTVTFLSGDVHHSYVSQVSDCPGPGTIVQAVCSPIRNPLPRSMRFATAALSYGVAGPIGKIAARSTHVDRPPFHWRRVQGPWFDNNLATLEVKPTGLEMWWATGVVEDGRHDRPGLRRVTTVNVAPDGHVSALPGDPPS